MSHANARLNAHGTWLLVQRIRMQGARSLDVVIVGEPDRELPDAGRALGCGCRRAWRPGRESMFLVTKSLENPVGLA